MKVRCQTRCGPSHVPAISGRTVTTPEYVSRSRATTATDGKCSKLGDTSSQPRTKHHLVQFTSISIQHQPIATPPVNSPLHPRNKPNHGLPKRLANLQLPHSRRLENHLLRDPLPNRHPPSKTPRRQTPRPRPNLPPRVSVRAHG